MLLTKKSLLLSTTSNSLILHQVCVAAALNDLNTDLHRKEALIYIENAFNIKNDYAGAYFMKGSVLRGLKQFNLAAKSFQNTIKYSSDKPDVLYLGLVNLGALLMHGTLTNKTHFGNSLTQIKNAKIALKEALQIEPKRYAPNANLAEVFSLLSDRENGKYWDKAIHYYKIASLHESVQSDLYNNYAIAVYKRAVYKNPKSLGMNVLNEVLKLYQKAIDINKNYVNPRRNIGKIYYRQKKYKLAIYHFKHCVRLSKLDGRCWYDLALSQMRTKDFKNAYNSFQSLFKKRYETGEIVRMDMSGIKLDQAKENFKSCKIQMNI
jgi:tetratricopeptide (TPR) repeat protein